MLHKFKVYNTEVENLCTIKIKCLSSDRRDEYHFSNFCESIGIIHETSTIYTSQQNEIEKRKNRTLTEMANAILSNYGLGKGLWGEALLTACHILDKVSS